MKISFLNTSYNYPSVQYRNQNKQISYPSLAPLKCDTVSFSALKKSKFSGIDLFVVEKFKAPIEKFNSNQDLQDWSEEKYQTFIDKEYTGKHWKTKIKRDLRIKEWDEILKSNDKLKPATKLLIISAVTSDLKSYDDSLPPAYEEEALNKSITELNDKLKTNPKKQYSFAKIYNKNLKKQYIRESREDNGTPYWIVIPSMEKDPEKFKSNVEKLQTLSMPGWCTRSYIANAYLERGDFHFLIENGVPKIGVLFKDGIITEIQSEKNDNSIPPRYFEHIKKHIKEDNKFKLGMTVREALDKAESTHVKITKIKKKLGDETIENADIKKIFKYFSIGCKEDENGNFTVKKYSQPSSEISFKDLGIDEDQMFEKITRIEGNAIFHKDNLNSLHNLQYVGGNVYIKDSKITPKDFNDIYVEGRIYDAKTLLL